MNMPATPFFRDIRMPASANDRREHERFLLDTLAERRAEEKPRRTRAWFKGLAIRAATSFR